MPYKSDAQRRFFNANRKRLEEQGVNVDEWNKSSKGLKLPERVGKGKRSENMDKEMLMELMQMAQGNEPDPRLAVLAGLQKGGRNAMQPGDDPRWYGNDIGEEVRTALEEGKPYVTNEFAPHYDNAWDYTGGPPAMYNDDIAEKGKLSYDKFARTAPPVEPGQSMEDYLRVLEAHWESLTGMPFPATDSVLGELQSAANGAFRQAGRKPSRAVDGYAKLDPGAARIMRRDRGKSLGKEHYPENDPNYYED